MRAMLQEVASVCKSDVFNFRGSNPLLATPLEIKDPGSDLEPFSLPEGETGSGYDANEIAYTDSDWYCIGCGKGGLMMH
jgi:hypothetical protein